MYIEDLSPFIYRTRHPWPNVSSVGWLDSAHSYVKGKAPNAFSEKLDATMRQRSPANVHACQIRGVHPCALCGKGNFEDIDPEYALLLGSTQLWIPGRQDRIFVAPSMILHYVVSHDYLPPAVFVAAIDDLDLSIPYEGQAQYKRIAAIAMANG